MAAAAAPTRPTSVVILGGGITGLSTAWYLARLDPALPITLYEKSPRLGGWLHSKRVEFDGGSVLFEQGPRTLRHSSIAGLATVDLIRQLKLEDEIALIPKKSAAARNRYIYFPDRLNAMPTGLITAVASPWTQPVMAGIFGGVLAEAFRPARPSDLEDESVGSFFTRRFNRNLTENLLSALLHGIYAGDIDSLSVKSLFPSAWRNEAVHGSLIRGLFAWSQTEIAEDQKLRNELHTDNAELLEKLKDGSVFSFKGGIETLSKALVRDLEACKNVTIKRDVDVRELKYVQSPDDLSLEISTGSTTDRHSHAVSTLYAPTLNNLFTPSARISALADIPAVTVCVVNLYFATPNLTRVHGFGYLLPKTVPLHNNPERALGVIFDSDTSHPDPASPGTKLTVMMGGHWWAHLTEYPTDDEAVVLARALIRRQLHIEEAPVATNVALQRNCIPQYTLGHETRCGEAHEALLKGFGGRLAVAGSSYRGVGMNDCIRSARDVAIGLLAGVQGGFTGLEGMGQDREWVPVVKPK